MNDQSETSLQSPSIYDQFTEITKYSNDITAKVKDAGYAHLGEGFVSENGLINAVIRVLSKGETLNGSVRARDEAFKFWSEEEDLKLSKSTLERFRQRLSKDFKPSGNKIIIPARRDIYALESAGIPMADHPKVIIIVPQGRIGDYFDGQPPTTTILRDGRRLTVEIREALLNKVTENNPDDKGDKTKPYIFPSHETIQNVLQVLKSEFNVEDPALIEQKLFQNLCQAVKFQLEKRGEEKLTKYQKQQLLNDLDPFVDRIDDLLDKSDTPIPSLIGWIAKEAGRKLDKPNSNFQSTSGDPVKLARLLFTNNPDTPSENFSDKVTADQTVAQAMISAAKSVTDTLIKELGKDVKFASLKFYPETPVGIVLGSNSQGEAIVNIPPRPDMPFGKILKINLDSYCPTGEPVAIPTDGKPIRMETEWVASDSASNIYELWMKFPDSTDKKLYPVFDGTGSHIRIYSELKEDESQLLEPEPLTLPELTGNKTEDGKTLEDFIMSVNRGEHGPGRLVYYKVYQIFPGGEFAPPDKLIGLKIITALSFKSPFDHSNALTPFWDTGISENEVLQPSDPKKRGIKDSLSHKIYIVAGEVGRDDHELPIILSRMIEDNECLPHIFKAFPEEFKRKIKFEPGQYFYYDTKSEYPDFDHEDIGGSFEVMPRAVILPSGDAAIVADLKFVPGDDLKDAQTIKKEVYLGKLNKNYFSEEIEIEFSRNWRSVSYDDSMVHVNGPKLEELTEEEIIFAKFFKNEYTDD